MVVLDCNKCIHAHIGEEDEEKSQKQEADGIDLEDISNEDIFNLFDEDKSGRVRV